MLREVEPHERNCDCFACDWYRRQQEIEERKKHEMKTGLKHNPFAVLGGPLATGAGKTEGRRGRKAATRTKAVR
jgi:hypothetical protein